MPKRNDMVPVRYCGPHDEVLIAATGLTVARGETVELAEWLATRLLEQRDTWQPGHARRPDPDAVDVEHQEDD